MGVQKNEFGLQEYDRHIATFLHKSIRSRLMTYQRTKQTLQIPFVLSSDSQISFRSAGLWFYNSFPYKIQSNMTLH